MNRLSNLIFLSSNTYSTTNSPLKLSNFLKWDKTPDKINYLSDIFTKLRKNDYHFTNFIITSLGETSSLSYNELQSIKSNVIYFSELFKYKLFFTNGDIFHNTNKDKLLLLKDEFLINVQRMCFNSDLDKRFLNYTQDYLNLDSINIPELRIDMLYRKNMNVENLQSELDKYINKLANLKYINMLMPKIYGTTINTNNINEFKGAMWILNNSYDENQYEKVFEYLNQITNERFVKYKDRFEWKYKSITILMNKKLPLQIRFGRENDMIIYGNKVYDYSYKEILLG